MDKWTKENIGHAHCYRVTDPLLRADFLQVVNDLMGVGNHCSKETNRNRSISSSRNVGIAKFPGTVPCSLMRSDLNLFTTQHYVAFEKTNGTRFLLLITKLQNVPFCVLIDPACIVRIVQLKFSADVFERVTLMDGELSQNEDTGRWTFLIFDLVSSGHNSTLRDNFAKRMRAVKTIVDGEFTPFPLKDPFDLYIKRYVQLSDMKRLYNANRHYQGFSTDGYIFVPVSCPVRPFRNRQLFKWKSIDNMTCDLELRINDVTKNWEFYMRNTEDIPTFLKLVTREEFDKIPMSVKESVCTQRIGVVIECLSYSPTQNCRFHEVQWSFVKHRTDKSVPNAEFTIQKTLENVKENITKEELFAFLDTIPFRERVPGGFSKNNGRVYQPSYREPLTSPFTPFETEEEWKENSKKDSARMKNLAMQAMQANASSNMNFETNQSDYYDPTRPFDKPLEKFTAEHKAPNDSPIYRPLTSVPFIVSSSCTKNHVFVEDNHLKQDAPLSHLPMECKRTYSDDDNNDDNVDDDDENYIPQHFLPPPLTSSSVSNVVTNGPKYMTPTPKETSAADLQRVIDNIGKIHSLMTKK